MHKKVAPEVRRRGTKRERTRERLLQCAAELVGELGFERTTLEAVAERAGMTRGSIYGNFRNRDELFLAVARAEWKPIVPQLVPGSSLREQMRALAEAVIAAASDRANKGVGVASFHQYVLSHPELQRELVAANQSTYEQMANLLLSMNKKEELPCDPITFVTIAHATIEGLLMLKTLTPNLISDAVIYAAFERLCS